MEAALAFFFVQLFVGLDLCEKLWIDLFASLLSFKLLLLQFLQPFLRFLLLLLRLSFELFSKEEDRVKI